MVSNKFFISLILLVFATFFNHLEFTILEFLCYISTVGFIIAYEMECR